MTELDDLYGPAIPAQNGGLRNWEVGQTLISYELNQATAQELMVLLSAAAAGQLGFDVTNAVTLLWIVTEAGDVVLALEETIETGSASRRPRVRGVPLNGAVKPLGHPLLVNGADARIAGELYIDHGSNGELVWVLNNKSGRYGLHKSRNANHLENVAILFRRYSLPVEIDFITLK